MCALVLTETGLLPHANAGALSPGELARLRTVSPSQGMMIESLNPALDCHRGAPDKEPARRLATLEAAGELAHPVHHRDPGRHRREPRSDRLDALEAIAASHRRHGHVQEVIVQNFVPKPGTAMWTAPACPPDEELWSLAAARLLLPPGHLAPGPAQPLRGLRPPARRRHRRLGRRVAGHARPRQPRAALAPPRAAGGRHRGTGLRAGAPADGLPPLRPGPRPVARPGGAHAPSWSAPTPRGSAATGPTGTPAAPPSRPASCRARPGPARPSPRCWPASPTARRSTSRRSSPSSRPGAGRWRPSPRWPTTCGAGPSATPSRGWRTATSTTPTSARSSAGSAPSRRGRCRSTSGATRTCSAWRRSSGGWSRRSRPAPPRSACRAASTRASTATTTSTSAGR